MTPPHRDERHVRSEVERHVAEVIAFVNGKCTNEEAGRKCLGMIVQHGEAILRSLRQGGGEVEYEYEVWQNDAWQAGGSTTDLAAAVGEASHYAMVYGQDGPVETRFYEKRQITPAASEEPK